MNARSISTTRSSPASTVRSSAAAVNPPTPAPSTTTVLPMISSFLPIEQGQTLMTWSAQALHSTGSTIDEPVPRVHARPAAVTAHPALAVPCRR